MSIIEAHEFNIAANYYDAAKEQWDGVILGNDSAKEGFAAAQIAGLDVVCFGYPGTGKTTFADRGHKTLGIKEENVAYIETNPNITHEHLLGDLSEFTETTEGIDGKPVERKVTFDSDGFIMPETQIIVADELNRLSPLGLNGLYKIMAERKAVTRRKGVVEFPELQYMISTMNPSETRQATFKVPDALASRHVIGLGFGISEEDSLATHRANMRGFTPKDVDRVADIDDLMLVRPYTQPGSPRSIRFEDSPAIDSLMNTLALKTRDILKDHGINDGLERQGMQVGRVARALALLRSQPIISTERDSTTIQDAYFYVTSARLGMLATDGIEAVKSLKQELDATA